MGVLVTDEPVENTENRQFTDEATVLPFEWKPHSRLISATAVLKYNFKTIEKINREAAYKQPTLETRAMCVSCVARPRVGHSTYCASCIERLTAPQKTRRHRRPMVCRRKPTVRDFLLMLLLVGLVALSVIYLFGSVPEGNDAQKNFSRRTLN